MIFSYQPTEIPAAYMSFHITFTVEYNDLNICSMEIFSFNSTLKPLEQQPTQRNITLDLSN